MISYEHAVFKYADYVGELDDLIPYIEDLIKKWAIEKKGEVEFSSSFEITIAAYLLKDGLLPYSAQLALADSVLKTISEAINNKLRLKNLMIYPDRSGRKSNETELFIRRREVYRIIKSGKSATEAYQIVAEKHFKSPETIRRDYERFLLNNPKYKQHGEFKK